MGMKMIYIAGPYRGDVQANLTKALECAWYWADKGNGVYVPHAVGHALDPDASLLGDDYWLTHGLAMLDRCDAIAFVDDDPGASAGTLAEYERALAKGIQCLHRWRQYVS